MRQRGRKNFRVLLFGLALLLPTAGAHAEVIRVSTCVLDADASESKIEAAAVVLRKFNPDVVLVERVRDWAACAKLAAALNPGEYNVVVCSSVGNASSTVISGQAAILARRKAYLAWSATSRDNANALGPFAFAAIQFNNQRAGFFAIQMDDNLVRLQQQGAKAAASAAFSAWNWRWHAEADSIRNWMTNRVGALFVAPDVAVRAAPDRHGSPGYSSQDAARALVTALREEWTVTLGPWSENNPEASMAPFNVESLATIVLQNTPGNYLLDLTPTQPPVVPDAAPIAETPARDAVKEQPLAAESKPGQTTGAPAPGSERSLQRVLIWVGIGAGTIVLLIGIRSLANRRARSTLVPSTNQASAQQHPGTFIPPAHTVVVAPQSVTGSGSSIEDSAPLFPAAVPRSAPLDASSAAHRTEQETALVRAGIISHMSQWLKTKLLRRLLRERAVMHHQQDLATLKVLAVDERLTRIERQLNEQNQMYLRRIEELSRQLASAREESRGLILAQINQVKAEMQAARGRLIEQAKSEPFGEPES